MNIPIGKKLLSKELPNILETYWDKSFDQISVTFDLSETEWISNSEILFLIGWVNYLMENKIEVSIQFPRADNLPSDSTIYQRRKFFYNKLLNDWRIKLNLYKDVICLDGGFKNEKSREKKINELIKIPVKEYNPKSFDEIFYQLYTNEKIGVYKNYSDLLNETNLNYLDSDFLNYSIIKELYSNVCIHSKLNAKNYCYYSLSLNQKIADNKANSAVLNERVLELSKLEEGYFTTNKKYNNINYVELNFQDFGIGISNSLKTKYYQDILDLETYFNEEFELHKQQNEDSKILHYALLLFTSQYEIDKKFEIHDFIPRGLFIIKELAEKYQGYLEIFSGKGAISLSYKNGVKEIQFVNPKNNKVTFQGTRIRLVFPSKDNIKPKKYSKIFKQNFIDSESKNQPCFISLLSDYAKLETEVINKSINKIQSHIFLTSLFFEKISKHISSKKQGSIILIDFSGIDIETNDIFSKFIYFISHTPSNASYRVVLFNVLVKELNSAFILNQPEYKSKGFFPYPVPVIYPDLNIEWLGIEDKELCKEINEIWKSKSFIEKYDDKLLRYSSSVLQISQTKNNLRIEIDLPSFEEILNEINEYISAYVQNEIEFGEISYNYLKNNEHDYNKVLKQKEGTVYHNSFGNYQESYLTFNDKLYIKSYRRLIATLLVFRTKYLNIDIPIEKSTKILSVTLSSQFLSFEVQKLFEEFFNIKVEIIALSNYYNFHNERRFKDIKKGDKILVINDIISTGRLTDAIFQSLERIEAKPICCLAIVDLRENNNLKFEYKIISLAKFSIPRIAEKPRDKEIRWINPILNSPVTIQKQKNELNTLLTKEEFLQFVDDEDILIGNMKNNSYYLTYFLDTYNMLLKDRSKKFILVQLILSKLQDEKKKSNSSELNTITKGLDIISKNIDDAKKKQVLFGIIKKMKELNNPMLFNDYKVDIVFYPFLSNISLIEENLGIFEQTGLNSENPDIYPIPRIQTERGWRFTFPPKFLNVLTSKKNLSVLILDDGSSTGSTLMQMIDSIAFLSIKSIDVLSIFGRLEDYQKELFSRLKSIRVKNNVVPLNTYFGVHFNLPVHNDKENPYLQQANEIEELKLKLKDITGDNFNSFISNFNQELNNIVYPNDLINNYPLFDNVSRKTMIQFRDKIGLFDSHRFYSEDILDDNNFDYFTNNPQLILTLLSVLNLEPSLYKTIKRLLPPKNIETLRTSIIEFLNNNEFNNTKEKQIFLITALQHVNPSKFIESDELIHLTKIAYNNNFDESAYQMISYLLFLIGFQIRNIEDVVTFKGFRSNIIDWLLYLKDELPEAHKKFRFFSETYRNYNSIDSEQTPLPINIYLQLSDYYIKTQNNEGSHDEKLLPIQLNELERIIADSISYIKQGKEFENSIKSKEFKDALKVFRIKYFSEYKTYQSIKTIVADLKSYGPADLEFDPDNLNNYILEFEDCLNSQNNYTKEKLERFRLNIDRYRKEILFSSSSFCKLILDQSSNIEEIWNFCESQITDVYYKKAEKKSSLNYIVQVNRYVLIVAFNNLIKNKNQYAQSINWEVKIESEESNRLDMRIIQNSSFITGGDGTGFNSIKEFLSHNGTFYKRINKNPFTLKIDFPLKNIL